MSNKALRSLKYHLVATGGTNLESSERKLIVAFPIVWVKQHSALTVLNPVFLHQSCELNS